MSYRVHARFTLYRFKNIVMSIASSSFRPQITTPAPASSSGQYLSLRVSAALMFLIALIGISACKSTPKVADCANSKSTYLHAQDHAVLQTPEGLETPDRRNALVIPAAKSDQDSKNTCLDRAPSYFGTAGRLAASPEEMVADWAQAWADRNADAVLAMYSSKFGNDVPDATGGTTLQQRRAEVADGPVAGARVKNLKITQPDNDRRIASFTQQFGASAVHKELTLIREGGVWKIVSEKVITVN